jgi:methylenetetrahydrofolate reductase (NADPH)
MRDEGQFQSGREISEPPRIFLGAAANPFSPPFDYRPHRLAKKVAAGAQFIQTQYCFDIERLKQYMYAIREMGLDEKVFVIVGVGPLASARAAEWIRNNVPGVFIPDEIVARLRGAEKPKEEGKKICVEMIEEIREVQGVSGVHVMAYRQEELVADIIDQSGALGGRVPWSP